MGLRLTNEDEDRIGGAGNPARRRL